MDDNRLGYNKLAKKILVGARGFFSFSFSI
jgi:hypothetical protein